MNKITLFNNSQESLNEYVSPTNKIWVKHPNQISIMAKTNSSALNKFKAKVSILKNILPKCAAPDIDLGIDRSLLNIKNQKARDVILAILMLPQKLKTKEHIKFLRKTLKEEQAFCELKKKVPKRVFNRLFEELRHEYILEHKEIYKSSETLKKFYVLLEGEVYSMIEKSRLLHSNKESIDSKDEFLRQNYHQMEVLNIFKPGDSFGGFSIISEDRQITTAVTKTHAHLAIIPIDIYKSLLGK